MLNAECRMLNAECLSYLAKRGQYRGGGERDREPPHHVANAAVDGPVGDESQVFGHHGALEHVRPLQHAAVWIDEAADSRVGGAREISSFLDRAERGLLPMLIC